MGIPMISLASHVYAGRRLAKGDEFEARGRQDARLLAALGRAEAALPPIATIEPRPQARQSSAQTAQIPDQMVDIPIADPDEGDEPEVEISPRTGRPKRTYRRRDMTAEG